MAKSYKARFEWCFRKIIGEFIREIIQIDFVFWFSETHHTMDFFILKTSYEDVKEHCGKKVDFKKLSFDILHKASNETYSLDEF